MKTGRQNKNSVHPNLLDSKKETKRFYLEFQNSNQDSSLLEQSSVFLPKFLEITGFANDGSGLLQQSFSKMIEKKVSENWPIFKQLFPLLSSWVSESKIITIKEQKAQETVLATLEKSIKQYQVLSKSAKDPDEIELSKKVLELLNDSKKKVRNLYKKEIIQFSSRSQPTVQETKSISDIFNFYAKQHIMTGRNPTFDMLGEIVENMDSGSFLAFTKHFGISSKKASDKRFLTKDEVLKIFRHCATLQKAMNLQGFTNALDEIAELFFNEEYEKLVPFKCADLDLQRKRIMLFEVLKLDNPHYVNKTCTPLRTPFGPSHDKNIKPTIGKKLVIENEEEVKEQINKYKLEKAARNSNVLEEKAKKNSEKSKIADQKIKEKKEQEDMQKRKDIFRMEDLDKAKFNDSGDMKQLEELID
jgi:hypothetical protein